MGLYLAPCGHEITRQFQFVARIAAGEVQHRCEICLAARDDDVARERGWSLVGPAPKRDKSYRLYQHECGHRQGITRQNMQTGRLNCAQCGTAWTSGPSALYLIEVALPDGRMYLKFGYSVDPELRLLYQLKRDPAVEGKILRTVTMPTGHVAIIIEKRIHAKLRREYPQYVIPREDFIDWLTVKSEIYSCVLKEVFFDLLDMAAAEIASGEPETDC
jgi:hypothetical protein